MLARALALSVVPLALCLSGVAQAQSCPAPNAPTQGTPIPAPLPVFPADNWWNTDISQAPVDANSANFINFIGATRRLHPDFGGEADTGHPDVYGFPYIVVNGATTKSAVTFDYWDESDGVNMSTGQGVPFYPIPANVISQPHWMEGGAPASVDQRGGNDRHILIVDCTNRTLYELYNAWYSTVGTTLVRRLRCVLRHAAQRSAGPKAGPRPMPQAWRSSRAWCATTKPPIRMSRKSSMPCASPCARATATCIRGRITRAVRAVRCRWARACA